MNKAVDKITEANEKKAKMDAEFIGIIDDSMAKHAAFRKSKMAGVTSAEIAVMGNFTHPLTGLRYGYKISIGAPDFFEEPEEELDEDDDDA